MLFPSGRVVGRYVPVSARTFPILVLQNNAVENEMLVCIDENSGCISDKGGDALFEADGGQSKFLEAQIETVTELRGHAEQTQHFIQKLTVLKLIRSNPVSVKPEGEQAYNLLGLYVIDELRLSELDESQVLELRVLGYLSAIYASLSPLYRLDHLVQRQAGSESRRDAV